MELGYVFNIEAAGHADELDVEEGRKERGMRDESKFRVYASVS